MNQKPNYAGYINPELKNQPGRIFTREEIKVMKPDDYRENEKAIYHQMNSIGIPSKHELENSSGVVHVKAYTKSDGTDVREHYRSWPEGHGGSVIESSNTIEKSSSEISGNSIVSELPEQKPDDSSVPSGQMNLVDGGVISGPLIGGVVLDVGSGIGFGSIIGAVTGVIGIVGGVALIIGGIIYAVSHPDKVKKAGKEILDDVETGLRELGNQIEKNMPLIEKQLSNTPGGKRTVELLKDLKELGNNNKNNDSNGISLPYDNSDSKKQLQNNLEKYKSISRELLNESKNLINQQDVTQKKLLNEITKTTDQNTYKNLIEKYSNNKQMINNQMTQIGKMEYFIDNNQFDKVINVVENSNNIYDDIDNNQNISQNGTGQTLQGHIEKTYTLPDWLDKPTIDFVNIIPEKVIPSTIELLQHGLTNLGDVNTKYNPELINSINEIKNTELRDYIKGRLEEILHKYDSEGLVYNSDSSLSNKIVKSQEFKKFIIKNFDKLYNSEVIKLELMRFNDDFDLAHSIHNATIYKAWIDQSGNFNAIIFDIYDYNESNEFVTHQAYTWQQKGYLKNYYLLVFLYLDKSDLLQIKYNK